MRKRRHLRDPQSADRLGFRGRKDAPREESAGGGRPEPTEASLEALSERIEAIAQQTFDSLRTIAERLGSQVEVLDQRSTNLELAVARIGKAVEAIRADVHKLLETAELVPTEPKPSKDDPPRPKARPKHTARLIDSIWSEEPKADASS